MVDDRCLACGEEIAGEPVYNANSVKPDAGEKLDDDEPVPISEVIAFDDGPYCSLDCSVDGDSDA